MAAALRIVALLAALLPAAAALPALRLVQPGADQCIPPGELWTVVVAVEDAPTGADGDFVVALSVDGHAWVRPHEAQPLAALVASESLRTIEFVPTTPVQSLRVAVSRPDGEVVLGPVSLEPRCGLGPAGPAQLHAEGYYGLGAFGEPALVQLRVVAADAWRNERRPGASRAALPLELLEPLDVLHVSRGDGRPPARLSLWAGVDAAGAAAALAAAEGLSADDAASLASLCAGAGSAPVSAETQVLVALAQRDLAALAADGAPPAEAVGPAARAALACALSGGCSPAAAAEAEAAALPADLHEALWPLRDLPRRPLVLRQGQGADIDSRILPGDIEVLVSADVSPLCAPCHPREGLFVFGEVAWAGSRWEAELEFDVEVVW